MSKLLDRKNREYEVNTYVNEQGAVIIPHEWIETLKEQMIFSNEIEETWATRNEDGRVYADLNNIEDPKLVYVCYIKDKDTGITYTGLGEFNRLNCPTSNISKSNPASICRNRAIDNAMLQFLGLKRDITNGAYAYVKLYSSAEISLTKDTGMINLNLEETNKPNTDTKSSAGSRQETKSAQNINDNMAMSTDNIVEADDVPINLEEENNAEPVDAAGVEAAVDSALDKTSENDSSVGSTIMSSGRNKGKTFDEILATDMAWWSWAKKTAEGEAYKLPKGVKNEILEYLKLHPEIPLK